MTLGRLSRPRWLPFAALAGLASACSLLAPDDEHFAGGSGKRGGGTQTCAPLPSPSGSVVELGPEDDLPQQVLDAASGTTLVLRDGTYSLDEELQFTVPNVTLRSKRDDPSAVIIDAGRGMQALARVSASNVALAHVTLTGALDVTLWIQPPGRQMSGFRMYGVRIVDGAVGFLRADGVAPESFVDQGSIECSEFELTDARRAELCCPSCLLTGVNIVGGADWVIRRSRFVNFDCGATQSSPPLALVLRAGARTPLIENNHFLQCQRSIALGFPDGTPPRGYQDAPYPGLTLELIDGVVRNNVIYGDTPGFDTGIEINSARTPQLVHNTVVYGASAINAYRSIDWRYAETRVTIQNNLVVAMGPRDGAQAMLANNLELTPLSYFVSPAGFDFHLRPGASGAIDQGVAVENAGLDLDGQPHSAGNAPDLGADEY